MTHTIDPRYVGQGGMPYNSPEGIAYRDAVAIAGKEHPEVYVLASQILREREQ